MCFWLTPHRWVQMCGETRKRPVAMIQLSGAEHSGDYFLYKYMSRRKGLLPLPLDAIPDHILQQVALQFNHGLLLADGLFCWTSWGCAMPDPTVPDLLLAQPLGTVYCQTVPEQDSERDPMARSSNDPEPPVASGNGSD